MSFNFANTLADISEAQESVRPISGPLAEIQKSKKPWEPFSFPDVEPHLGTLGTGIYSCIQRCIALALNMEVPVGQLALDGSQLTGDTCFDITTPDDMGIAMKLNAADEEKHFRQFKYAASAYDVPLEFEDEATVFQDRLEAMMEKEHPVLLAGLIELTLFFPVLAILRKWGSPGLRNATRYISRDEASHVNTNFWITDTMVLGLEDPQEFDRFRVDVIRWLTQDLKNVKELPQFWLTVSDNLYTTRKAPELEFTKCAMMPKNFELARY